MRYFVYTWKTKEACWTLSSSMYVDSCLGYDGLNAAYAARERAWNSFSGIHHYIVLEENQPIPKTLEDGLNPIR